MIADQALLEHALSRWSTTGLSDEARTQAARGLVVSAEEILRSGASGSIAPEVWHEFLRQTGKTGYLQRLGERELRTRWAEACFEIVRVSSFSLLHLFEQRVREHPDRILFDDGFAAFPSRWSYRAVARLVREIATAFRTVAAPATPRVALFTDNCAAGACCDLACLFYEILDTPLNVHFTGDVLAGIFDRLEINVAVTDTQERLHLLQDLRSRVRRPFQILTVDAASLTAAGDGVIDLGEACKRLGSEEIASTLAGCGRASLQDVATVMFTSGSTGVPKGVSFSLYNLVTKRFARAAALPQVGGEEVLLSYLPLFHTFGRYFEMLGTIYWGGTYVFVGNPSAESLLALLPRVQPTGLIGIPLRWTQLMEKSLERIDLEGASAPPESVVRTVVGSRLRWGLSAAGYLDPKVFQFFQRHGVDLCSGFGMTEATGGITMTPPGEYVEDTTGLPLPGVRARLTPESELEISGPYIARYLDDVGPGETIACPEPGGEEHWLATGDLFRILPNGYYQIVDRVKDIYKNDKGQTIAPQRVEKAFDGVPGIRRTFLVGDHRAYNVLLVVPDEEDPVLRTSADAEARREYYRRIVAAANRDVAPYERVVNFALLERDFSLDRGELTPKGSLQRKAIEKNFAERIDELYRSDSILVAVGPLEVRIPRWFCRDLGILEDEIVASPEGLRIRNTDRVLPLGAGAARDRVLVGDLEYRRSDGSGSLDLGLFLRQPRLWIGNPALTAFFPCREGWDVPPGGVSVQPLRPRASPGRSPASPGRDLLHVKDPMLVTVHDLAVAALFGPSEPALEALDKLGAMLSQSDWRWNEVLRTRLEALATHPDERMRCTAYRMLLLDDPTPDYGKAFPAFLESGLSFLNEESIAAIAAGRLEERRLEALRRRLRGYRTQLSWPASDVLRQQFSQVFRLLCDFAGNNPEYYNSVRSELAAWVLHRADPALARTAETHMRSLKRRFDTEIAAGAPVHAETDWDRRLVFDYGFSPAERQRVRGVVTGRAFLEQSVLLAYDEMHFDLADVGDGGIWISRIPTTSRFQHYRVCINTRTAKHFDLELVLGDNLREESVLTTVYWQLVLASWPGGPRVLPRLGCYSPRIGAMSQVFPGEPSVWEKIGELASSVAPGGVGSKPTAWRKLYIQSLSTFFRGLGNTGFELVPGAVSPNNVVVPELDFRSGGTVASFADWRVFTSTLSIVKPMVQNFYNKTAAHYPWCRSRLDPTWIFDACLEGMEEEPGMEFLRRLRADLGSEPLLVFDDVPLVDRLDAYLARPSEHLPLPLDNAVDRYLEWATSNPEATPDAREQAVSDLYRLYRLDRLPELVRYQLYRRTYFGGAGTELAAAFDRLLTAMRGQPGVPATQLLDLSDLQDALADDRDREAFSRLVFPHLRTRRPVQVLRVGEPRGERVVVSSSITDRHGESLAFREPMGPREIGQVYRYFFEQHIPKIISEKDRYFVLADANDRIVGGMCYQVLESRIAQLDGIAVAAPLRGRGMRGAMEEEFCRRMANEGIEAIRAHFFSRDFFVEQGYRTDKRWGGLVKYLRGEE